LFSYVIESFSTWLYFRRIPNPW